MCDLTEQKKIEDKPGSVEFPCMLPGYRCVINWFFRALWNYFHAKKKKHIFTYFTPKILISLLCILWSMKCSDKSDNTLFHSFISFLPLLSSLKIDITGKITYCIKSPDQFSYTVFNRLTQRDTLKASKILANAL